MKQKLIALLRWGDGLLCLQVTLQHFTRCCLKECVTVCLSWYWCVYAGMLHWIIANTTSYLFDWNGSFPNVLCPAIGKIKVRGRCEVPCLLTSGGNIISFSYSPRVAGSCGTSSCCSGAEIRVLQCCGTFMCYKNLCTTPVALWSCMEMLSPFQNKFSTGMWIFPASHCILGPQSILW